VAFRCPYRGRKFLTETKKNFETRDSSGYRGFFVGKQRKLRKNEKKKCRKQAGADTVLSGNPVQDKTHD
jgi:hypothetical protein